MADRVRLRHPETGGEWDCPAAAVDGWKELGWQEDSLQSKTKAELQGIAAERGVTVDPSASKADMVTAIENSEG